MLMSDMVIALRMVLSGCMMGLRCVLVMLCCFLIVRRVPLESPLWFVVYYTATVRRSSVTQRQPRIKIWRKITLLASPEYINTRHQCGDRAFAPHL
jgi:hypothetical protein